MSIFIMTIKTLLLSMLAIFAMPYLYLRLSPIISGYILIHYTKRTMQSLCLCIHVYLLRVSAFLYKNECEMV